MTFEELPEYLKDLKTLCKKYRSLPEDINTLKKALKVKPNSNPPFSFEINGLGVQDCIIKVKKIACKSLKGKGVNSGLRLVYAYFPDKLKIVFIELYHKSDKALEDKKRILDNFK